MYQKFVNGFPSINGYMYFRSNWSMNIFAWNGAQIVTIAQLLVCRKFFELSVKLFKVRMRAKKEIITFVAIVIFVKFSWDIFTAFIALDFGMPV